MRPLLILIRTAFVGIFWSIFFIEGIRVIMLTNWRFDIFNSQHWNLAWDLWLNGWVIKDPKEWAFVLIIITFIPLWFTGWAALSMIPWGHFTNKIILFPLHLLNKIFDKPVTVIKNTASIKAVKKKKSYKEVRPRSLRMPLEDLGHQEPIINQQLGKPISAPFGNKPQSIPKMGAIPAIPTPKTPEKFDHSLFQFDEEDDFDFNFDALEEKATPKPVEPETTTADSASNNDRQSRPNKKDNQDRNNKKGNRDKDNNPTRPDNKDKNNRNAPALSNAPLKPQTDDNKPRNNNSTFDVLKQKGFEIITSAPVKDTIIDYIGVSANQIYLCLLDKEAGDWLADEERFNDEEPLWFSESSHRISPVRKMDLARQSIIAKLADAKLEYEVKPIVVIQIGNIINAEDMFETWNNMNISVTRIDRGSPKELKLFSKHIEDADEHISKENFEKVKKLLRNI